MAHSEVSRPFLSFRQLMRLYLPAVGEGPPQLRMSGIA